MSKHEQHIKFGAILRKARERAEISLEQAADFIGISTASFSRMETGISKVTADRLAELASFYGISASAILEGELIQMASNVDINRMKRVVLLIQETISNLGVSPSPEKIAEITAQVYTAEIERLMGDSGVDTAFDADHHRAFIAMVFKN